MGTLIVDKYQGTGTLSNNENNVSRAQLAPTQTDFQLTLTCECVKLHFVGGVWNPDAL